MLAQAPCRLHRTNVSDWKRPVSIKPRTPSPQTNGFQRSRVRTVRKARYPACNGRPSRRRRLARRDSTWSTMPLRLRHTKRSTPRSTDRYIPVPTRLMGWSAGARGPLEAEDPHVWNECVCRHARRWRASWWAGEVRVSGCRYRRGKRYKREHAHHERSQSDATVHRLTLRSGAVTVTTTGWIPLPLRPEQLLEQSNELATIARRQRRE